MQNLIEFVNRGTFPFIGRKTERLRLLEFRNRSLDIQEMSVVLVTGEAGVGKSRLVEEIVPAVAGNGGVVVWGKLYSDSATLAPVLSRALLYSEGGSRLLRGEPEPTLPSVTASIRRLARLRPTLLVLEDIHLLSGSCVGELMELLGAIADEPIGLIAISQRTDAPASAVLSRYLVEEVKVGGLSREEIGELWTILFSADPDPEVIEVLYRTTFGNPMALRTALRNSLKNGVILQDHLSGAWLPTPGLQEFESYLVRDMQLLSGGMVAHLSENEKHAARILASLGESFAESTALQVIEGEGEKVLNSLKFKGILSTPVTIPRPLSGRGRNDTVFTFTHTLVHAHLLSSGHIPLDRLKRLIGEEYPLYSVVPYQVLGREMGEARPTMSEAGGIRNILRRITRDALALDETADWRLSHVLLDVAREIARRTGKVRSAEEERALELCLVDLQLQLQRRENHTEAYGRLVDRFEEMTRNLPEDLLRYRVSALTYCYQQGRRSKETESFAGIWEEVERLIGICPALQYGEEFVRFLNVAGRSTSAEADMRWTSDVEKWAEKIVRNEEAPEDIKYRIRSEVMPLVIWQFASEEELERRLMQAADLLSSAPDSIFVQTRVMALYEGIGKYREGLRFAERLIPRLRSQGLRRDLTQVRLFRLYALTGLAMPVCHIGPELRDILTDAPAEIRNQVVQIACWRLVVLLLIREEFDEAGTLLREFNAEPSPITYLSAWMLLNLRTRGLEMFAEVLEEADDSAEFPLLTLARYVVQGEDRKGALVELMRGQLKEPILTRMHVIGVKLVTETLERLNDRKMINSLRSDIAAAASAVLDWFGRHDLLACAMPTLKFFAAYLSEEEESRRGREIREALASPEFPVDREYERIRITMIGDITIRRPGEDVQRIRGGRIRTVLGLMAAGLMSEQKLSYKEFCRYAGGGVDDPERARKMTSMALLRLRETSGEDLVIEREGVPALNVELIDVDVVTLVRLLRDGLENARGGAFLRARLLLLEAMTLHAGEVPFPTLYDELFESLREEIDYLMRTALLETARGLIREEDPEAAEEVLRQGYEIMPDDDEIAELLLETLRTIGKHAEVQRILSRVREEIV